MMNPLQTKNEYKLMLRGWGRVQKNVLGSTNVVKNFSFSMFSSIVTFDFELILGSSLTFCGPNGLILGSC